jgi:Lrp/AsnC family transcriptional regulator, regulator for asnA, asnC and gidA
MKKKDPHRKTEEIDKIDCKIINLLQKDGRLSNTTIGKKLGISEATVRTRLHRLIKEEFIQIVAVSNPIKIGFQIVGNMRMQIHGKKMDHVIGELEKIEPIWFVAQTTGGTDIYAEFVVKSLDELSTLATNKINKIDGIIRTDTSLILKFIKRRYDWGTAFN